MAKLSAHGAEVGRVEYIGKVKAYFADGKVLVNHGQGWTTLDNKTPCKIAS